MGKALKIRGVFLQSPPIAFEQSVGRWLKEHTVQTQLFVFARGKDLVEGSALRRVLAGAWKRLLLLHCRLRIQNYHLFVKTGSGYKSLRKFGLDIDCVSAGAAPKLLNHGSPILLVTVNVDDHTELATLFHVVLPPKEETATTASEKTATTSKETAGGLAPSLLANLG